MMNKKPQGPGRQAADGATNTKNISFALTDVQRAWIVANGRSLKVRALINKAMADEAAAEKRKRAK